MRERSDASVMSRPPCVVWLKTQEVTDPLQLVKERAEPDHSHMSSSGDASSDDKAEMR